MSTLVDYGSSDEDDDSREGNRQLNVSEYRNPYFIGLYVNDIDSRPRLLLPVIKRGTARSLVCKTLVK